MKYGKFHPRILGTPDKMSPEQNLNIKEDIPMNNKERISLRLAIDGASEGVGPERGMRSWH